MSGVGLRDLTDSILARFVFRQRVQSSGRICSRNLGKSHGRHDGPPLDGGAVA